MYYVPDQELRILWYDSKSGFQQTQAPLMPVMPSVF